MIVSLRWLQEFVDLPTTDPAELEEALSSLGLEVEGIAHVRPTFTGVIVAKALEVSPHPDADRLRLVRVDRGDGEQEVVCGAWNFEAGAIVPLATVGATLSMGGEVLEVGERTIRGVASAGMICSERELGIGDDADGILVLGEGDAAPALGTDFGEWLPLPDVLFDLSITPNRPDAMGVLGVARELAARYDLPLRAPQPVVTESGPATTASVTVQDPELCPRFTAREVRNVTVGPSPLWMRMRLRAAGVRPISNAVDITNYVMLEYGQPLHAFDLDRVPRESIIVRTAGDGEALTTLDGVARTLTPQDLVIAHPEGATGLAGIMGGGDSEVSAQTTRILVEVAHFQAPGILLTAHRHGIRTEASARFERGVDPALPPVASARAAELLTQLAGGEPAPEMIDVYPDPIEPWQVMLPVSEVKRILGIALSREEVVGLLERLGFACEGGDELSVTVPTHRPDVTRAADLVEEVARLHGLNEIPDSVPRGSGGGLGIWEQRRRIVQGTLVAGGYHETMSFAFVGPDDHAAMALAGEVTAAPVALRNPLSEEHGLLRTSLLPGLLRGLAVNEHRFEPVRLFEIGRVFSAGDGVLPAQPHRVAFAATPGRDGTDVDVRDAVGAWERLAARLDLPFRLEQTEQVPFHPGRTAAVIVDGAVVGHLGEIHPAVAGRFDLVGRRVAAGEIDLEPLTVERAARQFVPPSAYPPLVFDMAFDVPEAVPAADVAAAIRLGGSELLEDLILFDVFTGPPLEEGRKSLAYRLVVRDRERTLSDEDVVPLREAVTARVAADVAGRLRGG